jgi:hypothetical protein
MVRQCSSAAGCAGAQVDSARRIIASAERSTREASMTSRRQFLEAGLAASALLPAGAWAAQVAPLADRSLYKVLYDTRFPASAAFARRAAARGLAVHAIAGDMTRFWYDDLYHRWRQGPAAIAGLTAHGPLFCLERLGWEQRMRVVYRREQAPVAGEAAERLFSWVIAPVARA